MSDQKLKIAVFIDFDNIEIGVKTTLNAQFDIGAVLEAIKERGEVVTKLAYGDWKRSGDHGRAMAQHAVRMVQRVMTPGGDKNGADINLALDALEMAFTHAHINAFVIVGGDSDFITLVEKLKQYDRKVFVVGGRAFTSQVMQKNCTEFIAYENVISDPSASSASPRAESRGERGGGRQPKHDKGPRQKSNGTHSIEQAVPLVRRALKVLTDREVSPQLGLLKSTLLQLDSSFSERDYGVGSFREFADKLAGQGLVALKHQGRSTLVELPDVDGSNGSGGSNGSNGKALEDTAPGSSAPENLTELLEQPDSVPQPDASLGDGVALVRRVLAETTTQPRWPMYPRQFKQFLRNAHPDFDERKYGSIADLMRACQKDGLLRLERDRQGALRVFAGGSSRPSVPHGWSAGTRENGSDQASETPQVVEVIPEVIAAPVVDAQITEVVEETAAPAPKAKRARAKKTAAPAGEKKKAAPRKKKTA
ncbi:MAG: NYN domain-containing protein [Cyanobacteria bacterium]|nr:NYN domain-containing protein [Cyanobacteriota bacterium]